MTTDAARLAAIAERLVLTREERYIILKKSENLETREYWRTPTENIAIAQATHDAAAVLELVTALEHARIAIQGVRDAGVEHMGFLSSEVVQHIDKALARYAPEVTK